MTFPRTLAFAAITLAAAFTGATASAAPPANIGGTNWTLQANRESTALVITNQGGPGGPGGATCRLIIGTIGIAPIRGWYCPSTGRIHFLHKNLDSGATVRVFTGNLSDEDGDEPLYMGGTMTVVNTAFGPFGEFNFSAVE